MSKKIAIISDDPAENETLSGILSEKYEVITIDSISSMHTVLLRNGKRISAIILDIVMTDGNGYKALQTIKDNAVWKQIPVIAVTEHSDEESQVKAMTLGANGFIQKPCNSELLHHMVANTIELHEKSALANSFRIDKLTGMFNRQGFIEVADFMVHQMDAGYYTLSCFDIENFKIINDQYGIEKGDKVLQYVAGCIKSFINRVDGVCCRITADNFAILYPTRFSSGEQVLKMHKTAMAPDCINRHIRIRIGRYVVDDLSVFVSVMFDRATMAAESVKGRYDEYIAEYNNFMRSDLLRQQQIINDMNRALESGEFEPFFQPQYNHATGALVGAEALVRWRKDDKFISPAEFIPVFERNGFIYEMDKYIWEKTCSIMRGWIDEGISALPVSVNISRCDVLHDDFVSQITGIVNKYHLPFDMIRIEVTESAFSESTKKIISRVTELIKLGFTVEIDDFGSGFSSLNTLKDVPASILKLDMKFFENTGDSQRSGNIIESVVRMAKWLGMAVIAEGVEEKEQADYLKSIGCFYIQGYFYSKPVPTEEYRKLLDCQNKEHKLTGLETLKTLDNNEFWNPKSMETLIFNSYVGGACIFEYSNKSVDVLRTNEQYSGELGYFKFAGAVLSGDRVFMYLDDENKKKFADCIHNSINLNKESSCELILSDGEHFENIRMTLRVIARAGDRFLFYCVIVNMTEQRNIEKRELENAQHLEVIMSNINGGVSAIQISDDGVSHLIFNNDRYYELYGYTRQQADDQKLDIMKTILPEDLPTVMEKIKKLKQDHQSTVIDYRVKKPNGKVVYLRANSSMMHMDGYDDVIASVVIDVTEQHAINDQLRAIVENIYGGVTATIMRNGTPEFIIINDRYVKMLGYDSREQYEKENTDKYGNIHPDDRERIIKQFDTSDGGKKHYTMEYRVICRDGMIRYIRNNISIINLFGIDEPVQLSVANDITEIRLAQQKERCIAQQMQIIMKNINGGIMATVYRGKEDVKVVYVNDQFYEMYGYTAEQYKSEVHDVLDIIYPDDREKTMDMVARVVEEKGSASYEYRCRRRDGKIIWVKCNNSIVSIDGISDTVLLAVTNDVTAEMESFEQLRFLNESAHDVLTQADSSKAINQALKKLIDYFDGDRAYVIELDNENKVTNNTYEICKDKIKSVKALLHDIPFAISEYWFEAFKINQSITIENVENMDESKSELKKLLLIQNIHSLIVSPLFRDGVLIGFTGIDNPTRAVDQISNLKALGDYIAILLTRRDLTRKISHDSDAMQTLMNDTPGGFCRIKIHQKHQPTIEYINNGFCRLLNMTHDQIISEYGNDVLQCLNHDDIELCLADSVQALRNIGQFTTRCGLRRSDGQYLRVMISGRFVKDETGVVYLNSYFTDITRQEEEEEQQKKLLDNLPCGAALYEFDGKQLSVVHINKKYWQLVEREPVDYKDTSVFDVIYESDRNVVYQEIKAAINQNRDASCDIRIKCGNDQYHPFHITASIKLQCRGKYSVYAAYTKLSDHIMSIQEMLPVALSTMMSISGDRSYVKGKDLRYICCSKSAYQAFGFKNEREIIGKNDFDLFDQKTAQKISDDDRKIMESGKSVINKIEQLPFETGGVRFSDTSKYPIVDTSGTIIGIYGISRDVTVQKERESQLELLTESIPGGLAAFELRNEKIKMLYFNDGFYRFSGYNRDEYISLTADDPLALMFEEDREKIYTLIHKVSQKNNNCTTAECTYRCSTKDDSFRWMSMKSKLAKINDNQSIINIVQFDITDQKEREEKLRIASEEYKIAAAHGGRTICNFNIADKTIKITKETAQRLCLPEYISDVPYGRVKLGIISAATSDAYIEFYEKIMHGEKECTVMFEKQLPNVGWRWINAQSTTIFGDDGNPVSAVISYIDVTDQNQKEEIYNKWQQSLNFRKPDTYTLFRCNLNRNNSFDSCEGTLLSNEFHNGAMTFDECSLKYVRESVYVSDRKKFISEIKTDKLIADYYRGSRRFIIEYREVISLNNNRWIRLSVELVEQPYTKNIMAYLLFENIDKAKKEILEVLERSQTDPLTGVLNRKTFETKVDSIISKSGPGQKHVMMMLDVDSFKHINDAMGHKTGDQVLIEITKNIRSVLRHGDLIGRLGGDEFMLFFINISEDIADTIAQRICDLTRKQLDDDVTVSISLGITVFPEYGKDFASLYKKADKALYYVKDSGKNNYIFYSSSCTRQNQSIDNNDHHDNKILN